MAFEREAIASTPLANPNLPPNQMREDFVVEPYKISGPSLKSRTTENIAENRSEESATPAESVTLSPAAAAIARKEQKFRQEQLKFRAEQQSLEAERKEIAELKALKAKLALKDFSGIESQVPYEDYVNYLINKGQTATPEQAEVKAIRAELEAEKKARQDDVSKRFDAAVAERKTAIDTLLTSKPDDFKRIKKMKMEEHVLQHLLDTWEHDGKELSPEQAALEIEKELTNRATMWAGLNEESTEALPVEEKKTLPPLKTAVKTLTNNMSPVGEIARPRRSFEGMSDGERYAEARRRAEEKIKAGLA